MGLASSSPKKWLPGGVWDTITWFIRAATWAFGTSSPTNQVASSVALMIFAILTSALTLGATLWAVGFFAITGLLGILRFFPAINDKWVAMRTVLIPEA